MTDKVLYIPGRDEFLHALDVKQAMDMVASQVEMETEQAKDFDREAQMAPNAMERIDNEVHATQCREDAGHCGHAYLALHGRLMTLMSGWPSDTRQKVLDYTGATGDGVPEYWPPVEAAPEA